MNMDGKKKIILFSTLAIILLIGAFISLNHKRPGKIRGKSLDSKKEVKLTLQRIKNITDSIALTPQNTGLYFQRAKLYFTINKWDEAIADYNTIIKTSKDTSEISLAKSKLKSCKQVKNYLNKNKTQDNDK